MSLVKVNVVNNYKDSSKVLFRATDGKIVYLDRKDENNDMLKEELEVGDELLVALTTSNDTYDFGIAVVFGMTIEKFGRYVPNIDNDFMEILTDFDSDTYKDVRLLLNILIKLPNVRYTELGLENLLELRLGDDDMRYTTYLPALQYLYTTVRDGMDNFGIDVPSSVIDMVKSTNLVTEQSDVNLETVEPFTVTAVNTKNDFHTTELEKTIATLMSLGLEAEAEAVRVELVKHNNSDAVFDAIASMEIGKIYGCIYSSDLSLCSLIRIDDNDIVLSGCIGGTTTAITTSNIKYEEIKQIYKLEEIFTSKV